MPCYTVSRASVKLKVENAALLQEALKSDTVEGLSVRRSNEYGIYGEYKGYSYEINREGQVVADESVANDVANAINRAYSRSVIKKASRKFGWALNAKSDVEFVASKRGL